MSNSITPQMIGVQAASRVGIILGVATIILGILALVAPQIAGLSITVTVTVMLGIFFGVESCR